jgi:DNA-binding CsgD family transcriptional regulator
VADSKQLIHKNRWRIFLYMKSSSGNLKSLTANDVAMLSTLCERIHYTNSRESFSNHAFVILKDAFLNAQFSVERYRFDPLVLEEALNEGIPEEIVPAYHAHLQQHPLMYYFLTRSQSGVRTILTKTTSAEFQKKDLYQEFYRRIEVEDQLVFKLPHGEVGYVISYSRDQAFTEKEQAMMQILRPHVQVALENWQRIRDLEQRLQWLEEKTVVSEKTAQQAGEARRLMDSLSARERAVAEQVALGLENRKIAEVLHISPKTVGKHLENIFETLQIHHRAALASVWRQSNPF